MIKLIKEVLRMEKGPKPKLLNSVLCVTSYLVLPLRTNSIVSYYVERLKMDFTSDFVVNSRRLN